MAEARRVGILGGTFDPPHIGHLVLGLNTFQELSLARVLLVVSHMPWQKLDARQITPAATRLELVRAAVAGHPGLEACDLEITLGGESSTVRTLEALREREPNLEPVLVLGADAAAGIPTWRRASQLAGLADLAVACRGGHADEAPNLSFWPKPVAWVSSPGIDISSSDIRELVRRGRRIDFLVPDAVAGLVDRLGLYR